MLPLDALTEPFWLSTTMHDESVIFIADADAAAEARLLFPADTILGVTNATGDAAYVEGVDYRIDRRAGVMVRTPGSRMPHVTPEALARADGSLLHEQLVVVSYTHAAGSWMSPVPHSAEAQLPRVAGLLRRHEPLRICLAGDSISEGYDASGFHGLRPYQPPFAELMASTLNQRHGARVQLNNLATAGWTAADALWDTPRIAAATPDLVIIAFGMNDATYADADEFAANISGIIQRVRRDVPLAEFVLVAPMVPAPACTWLITDRFDQYRVVLGELTGAGIALADITTLWRGVLARKQPYDLSGNGLNHPNDFGHRLYAQAILTLLSPSNRTSGD